MQQTRRQNNPTVNAAPAAGAVPSILPAEKTQALNMLIRVTQNLINLSERESQSLAQNDLTTFAILQDEKSFMADQYSRVSEEFRANINLYRGADKNMLNRLEALQNMLAERTRDNNTMVNTLYERSRASTQSVLLAAQEMGQKVNVNFPAGQHEQK